MNKKLKSLHPALMTYLSGKPTSKVDMDLLNKLLAQLAEERQAQEEINLLGPTITESIETYLNNHSFLRKFLRQRTLEVGQETKSTVSISWSLASDGETPVSHTKQREVYLREIYTLGTLTIEHRKVPGLSMEDFADLVDEVAQVLCLKENSLLAQLVKASGRVTTFEVVDEGLLLRLTQGRPGKFFVSSDLWNSIVANPSLASIFDPVIDHAKLLSGFLGYFRLGQEAVEVHLDSFIPDNLRTFDPGSIIFFARGCGENLIRRPLTPEAINQMLVGIPARGWVICEVHAPFIADVNRISVARKAQSRG